MNCVNFLIHALAFTAIGMHMCGLSAMAQSEVESNQPEGLRYEADIVQGEGSGYIAKCELDALPAGKKFNIELVLNNSANNRPIKFDKVRLSCTCMKATVVSGEIASGGAGILKIALETPIKNSSEQQILTLSNKADGTESLTVIVQYRLKGLVCFRDNMIQVDSADDDDLIEWDMPLILTPPADKRDLVVTLGTSADGFKYAIDEHDSAFRLRCSVPRFNSSVRTFSTEISIEDRKLGRNDKCVCIFNLRPKIEVSPTTIRLRKEEKGLVGSCLLRIREDLLAQPKLASGDSLRVNAFVNGITRTSKVAQRYKLASENKELSSGVYRVQLELKDFDGVLIENEKLFLEVRYGSVVETIEVIARVSSTKF